MVSKTVGKLKCKANSAHSYYLLHVKTTEQHSPPCRFITTLFSWKVYLKAHVSLSSDESKFVPQV